MCLNIGTPKNINFSFETNGKLMALGVPILKHIRVCAHTFASNWEIPFLNQWKEKWKHVARLGIEPGISGYWVRRATRSKWILLDTFNCVAVPWYKVYMCTFRLSPIFTMGNNFGSPRTQIHDGISQFLVLLNPNIYSKPFSQMTHLPMTNF